MEAENTTDRGNGTPELTPARVLPAVGEAAPSTPPTTISIAEGDRTALTEIMERVVDVTLQHSDARAQFLNVEKAMLERKSVYLQEREAIIRGLMRRLGVPDSWVLNMKTFTFSPPTRG